MKFAFLRQMRDFGIALAILSGVAAAVCTPVHAQSAPPQASTNTAQSAHVETVIVFPFENAGTDAQKDWLGEALSELTTDSMIGHGPLVFSREERLAALEKLGLPAYSRFSRATMIKIATEIDADYVVFGEFTPDGANLHVSARVLRVSPPKLSEPLAESGGMDSIAETEARVAGRILCEIKSSMAANGTCNASSPVAAQVTRVVPHVRPDALEYFVRGLLASEENSRLADLREASRLDPAWDEPIFVIGEIFYERRDCETATGWFARVSTANAHSMDAAFYTGACQLLRNDPVKAEATFSALLMRATMGQQTFPAIVSNLGTARLRQTRYKEAAGDFEKAQRIDPGEPDYWFNLGLAHYLISDWPEAARALREVVRLQPDSEEARGLLLAALDRGGNTEEANALRQAAPAGDAMAEPADLPHDAARPKQDVTKMSVTSLAKLARVRMGISTEAGR
jgi:tetratricopeptide (TPR) repeat protein